MPILYLQFFTALHFVANGCAMRFMYQNRTTAGRKARSRIKQRHPLFNDDALCNCGCYWFSLVEEQRQASW
jgi:hypothetical protein